MLLALLPSATLARLLLSAPPPSARAAALRVLFELTFTAFRVPADARTCLLGLRSLSCALPRALSVMHCRSPPLLRRLRLQHARSLAG